MLGLLEGIVRYHVRITAMVKNVKILATVAKMNVILLEDV